MTKKPANINLALNFFEFVSIYICNEIIHFTNELNSKTMNKYKYHIGCTDYLGKNNDPDRVLNENLVPYLESCGLNEDQIKEVKNMVSEIAEDAFVNGYDSAECSLND